MTGLIDYAGLFPPAKLSMQVAADNYDRYIRSADAWILGRFVCPVSRLEEFRVATAAHLPGQRGHTRSPAEPWRLSALIDGDLDENLDAIFAFNHEHEQPSSGLAVIDSIELKAPDTAFIDNALDLIPDEIHPFFEIPVQATPEIRGHIACLAGADAAAKIRTGGVTPDAFPTIEQVAGFLLACAQAGVPFKATAGLHHAVRAEYNLTYEPGCPRAAMHGFLNVFMAAAMLHARSADTTTAAAILEEPDAKAFRFTDESAAWRDHRIDATSLAAARESFALSYGSCSFEEPVEELGGLGLL